MTEPAEQWICIRLCIKFEHSSMEIFHMIQKGKPQLCTTGDGQLHHNNVPHHGSRLVQHFFCKTSNHPGDSVPYSPDLESCNFWLFSKLKSLLKGKFQTISEIQENARSSSWRLRGLCKVPRCLLWRGLRCHCPIQSFLYLVYSSINVSIFHGTWLDAFWTDLIYPESEQFSPSLLLHVECRPSLSLPVTIWCAVSCPENALQESKLKWKLGTSKRLTH